MKLRYNYRLNPNKEQEELLKQVGGTTRFLWNYFLQQNIKLYEEEKKFSFWAEMCLELPKLKKELVWLKNTYSQKIKEAALNYWNGVLHYNESVWEYLTLKAKVIAVEEY